MLLGQKWGKAASCCVALIAPFLMGASGLKEDFAYRLLESHNVARAQVGSPPVRWNPALAASAQAWIAP